MGALLRPLVATEPLPPRPRRDPHPAPPSRCPRAPTPPRDPLRWPEQEVQGREGCRLCFPPRPAPAPPESAWAPPPHTHPAPRHCRGSPEGETEARREAERDCQGHPGQNPTQSLLPASLPSRLPSWKGGSPSWFSARPTHRVHFPPRFLETVHGDFPASSTCGPLQAHLGAPADLRVDHHPLPGLQPLPPARGTPGPGAPAYPARSHSSVPSFLSVSAPPLCPSLLPQSSDSPVVSLVINGTAVTFPCLGVTLAWGGRRDARLPGRREEQATALTLGLKTDPISPSG